jgi:hypothetical protein
LTASYRYQPSILLWVDAGNAQKSNAVVFSNLEIR